MVRFLDLPVLRRYFAVWLVNIYAFHRQGTRLHFYTRQPHDCSNLRVRSGFLSRPGILFRQNWCSMAIPCRPALLSNCWLRHFDWVRQCQSKVLCLFRYVSAPGLLRYATDTYQSPHWEFTPPQGCRSCGFRITLQGTSRGLL